jgi:phenylpyruvate tautomerase PptA (4-oxalocrotonate tautomerase family)
MPYLQLDVSRRYRIEVKRRLAQHLGRIYAAVMQTIPDKVTVGFRELEEGSLWRCGIGDAMPAVVLMCDIRRGRSVEQRARLAEALVAACVEALALTSTALLVEFTQHAGDEIFVPDRGLACDWTPAEAQTAASEKAHASPPTATESNRSIRMPSPR